MRKKAQCHPNKPHSGRGLCQNCYKKWQYDNDSEIRERIKASHKLPIARERARAYKRRKYAESQEYRDIIAERGLKGRYGISFGDFLKKMEEQNNLCPACDRPFVGAMRERTGLAPTVHHDHSVTKPHCLAIVHRTCNAAMGQMNDDPELLQKLADFALKMKRAVPA